MDEKLLKTAVTSVDASTKRRQNLWRRSDESKQQVRKILLPDIIRTWNAVDNRLRDTLLLLAGGGAPWPLYLYGSVGTGKTRASLTLVDHAQGSYWTVTDLMDRMRERQRTPWPDHYNEGSPEEAHYVAVLDELGTHRIVSDFEYDAVYKFVRWREDLPAIYISNHPPSKIRTLYDRRIESRITCGTAFHLDGPDRRATDDS